MNMIVAEVPGASLKRRLQKSDPFRESKCRDIDKGMVCAVQLGKEEDAGVKNTTYEVSGKGCEGKFIGETSRNWITIG